MHSWVENEGGRGSKEVISSLCAFMLEADVHGETLIALSDSFGGQNKNFYMMAFGTFWFKQGRFKKVFHKFPNVGHSYCDRDFGLIRKQLKKHQQMFLSEHCRTAIRDKTH